VQGGVDVIVGQVAHPWQFGIKGDKGGFMGMEHEFGDMGALRHGGTFPHFA